MRAYLTQFFEKFDYAPEDRDFFLRAYDGIAENGRLNDRFEKILRAYVSDGKMSFEEPIADMAVISEEAGIHVYTGNFLMFVCLSETLLRYYRETGVEERIWHTSLCDLKWKLAECKSVYGIPGTFVPGWYGKFFRMERFGFLKQQFEIARFGYHYEKDGVILTPESRVLKTHIPRTGTRLDRESVTGAYEAGGAFFRDKFGVSPAVFVCDSWLLYPWNKEVLSPESNLYAFISDYDILKVHEFEDYSEVWRLFDVRYDGDVNRLPQDTSLRRAYADRIRRGEKIGAAYGVRVPVLL